VSVLAEPPVRALAPFPDTTGQFCDDFQVLIHALTNKEVVTLFSDGRIHVTGSLKAEVTNLATQKTIVVNASGPFKISSDGQKPSLAKAEGYYLVKLGSSVRAHRQN
jgi:hypothetical protein